MHEETSIARAVDALLRSLPRIPFLRFGDGADTLALAYRKKGALIEDPDCDQDFEVLQPGVYQRFRKVSGAVEGFTWMRIGALAEEDLRFSLIERLNAMSYVEIESLPLDAGWQVMQWEEAAQKNADRSRRSMSR